MSARRLFAFAALGLPLACGGPSRPPNEVVVPAAPASSAPRAAPEAPSEARGPKQIDGVALGSPVRALLARFGEPCDVDPIDHKSSSLYFWAAGPCRQARPFPEGTTVVVITSRAKDAPPEEQPIELVAWTGGHYFDSRASLPIHVGEAIDRARDRLGAATRQSHSVVFRDGARTTIDVVSWDGVHVLALDGVVTAIAVGEMDPTDGTERGRVLDSIVRHHARYAGK